MRGNVKVALVQGVCPHYRVPFFRRLSQFCDLTVYYGRGDRQGAYRNANRISGFRSVKLPTLRCDLRFLHPYLQLNWFPGLRRELKKLKPDLVVTGGVSAFPNTLTATRFCRRARVPTIVWDSGRDPAKRMPWYRRILEPLNSKILTRADACIAYSSVAAAFFASSGVSSERVFIAQNTVDVEQFLEDRRARQLAGSPVRLSRGRLNLDPDSVVLLYVGAIEKRKRLERLLDTGEELRRRGLPASLVIVGDGPHRAELEADARRRPVNVRFPGRIVKEVGEYFSAADVFVLPGPGGLSINQAMAYALPVVVWGGDGTERDLVEAGEAGFVVGSYLELLDRTATLASDADLRRRMGENGLRQISQYDLGNMVGQFCRAFDYVLRNKPR